MPVSRQEYESAVRDIRDKGVYGAIAASRDRLEQVTADALGKAELPIACQAGCGHCCNYRIYARPEEIFIIVDYLRSRFPPDEARVLREKIRQNAKFLRNLSYEERLSTNLECALLKDGSCSIYPVRPEMCRVHFSSDVNICIRTIEKPDDRSIVHNLDAGLHQAVHAHCDAFKQALSESGHEIRTYEMNLTLAASLTDNGPRKRYERHKQAFAASIAAG